MASLGTVLLNVSLGGVVAYLLYKLIAPTPTPGPPRILKKRELPLREFTLATLRTYDGKTPHAEHDNEKPVYLAVNYKVFDVTGSSFYAPGGPYSVFAGHDASRGLSTMTFVVSDEWDDLADLGPTERNTMMEWHDKFASKYIVRGTLVKQLSTAPSTDSPAAAAAAAAAAASAATEAAPTKKNE